MTSTLTAQQTFDAFATGTLGKDEWTHEAHLVTCWMALRDRTPAETVAYLRTAIKEHNCGIGIQNTATSGYHETLTVFYVAAVAAAEAATPEALFDEPSCDRSAALKFWGRELLFSAEARAGWVEPEFGPLPWSVDHLI